MMRRLFILGFTMAHVALAGERPNILLIMVDDMGFSDLGCYGGEIKTPHIDALATNGVRFSQFTNGARCCPTRASLLTGLYPHQTGIGHMTNSPTKQRPLKPEAYQGFLNDRCATLGELLRPAGYRTLMTGKWHLGIHDQSRWPLQRGFDRFYGCLAGAARYFVPEHPRGITLNNTPLKNPPSTTDQRYYTTDAFTDYAINFLSEKTSPQPWFLYLAYNAPHWPLQAFEEDIAKYRNKYKIGWDKLREQRYARQIELGLIKKNWKLTPRPNAVPAWDSLSEEKQDEMDLKMAVYAAMVDRVDQNIGKLTSFLKRKNLFDNTLILFLSDNGACHEGGVLGRGEFYKTELRNQQDSNSYGEAWANVGSTPFRLYKSNAHQGGSATPLIAHWPRGITPQANWQQTPAHITDLVPTILEVAGAQYPTQINGKELLTLHGKSLLPAFCGEQILRERPFFLEHQKNAFVRDGKWKLVGKGHIGPLKANAQKWELYDLDLDRTELNNLASKYPERVKKMAAQWNQWAKENQILPKKNS